MFRRYSLSNKSKLVFFATIAYGALHLLTISCKHRDKVDSDAPRTTQEQREASSAVTSFEIKLHDFQVGDEFERTETAQLHLVASPAQGESTAEAVAPNKDVEATQHYPITEDLLAQAQRFGIVLAQIHPNGIFYNVQDQQPLNPPENKCLHVAYDLSTEVFYLAEAYAVDHFFMFVPHTPTILFSGQVCLNDAGQLSAFKNDGVLSLPEKGLENFVKVLVQRGFHIHPATSSEGTLKLAGGRVAADLIPKVRSGAQGTRYDFEGDVSARREQIEQKGSMSAAAFVAHKASIDMDAKLRTAAIDKKAMGEHNQVTGIELHTRANLFPWADGKDPRVRAASLLTNLQSIQASKQVGHDFFLALESGKKAKGFLPDGSRYEITGGGGTGGFGSVSVVRIYPKDGQGESVSLALKTFSDQEGYRKWKAGWEFRNRLSQNPHILQDFAEVVDHRGRPIVIMEELNYRFDMEKLSDNHKMRHKVMADAIDGVRHLHDHGLMHRDLKLENIMGKRVGYSLTAKIVDLDGISPTTTEYTRTKDVQASQLYKSPEMDRATGLLFEVQNLANIPLAKKKGLPDDWAPSDVYSLGLTFLEMKMGMSVTEYKVNFLDNIFTNITKGGIHYRFTAGSDGKSLYNKMKKNKLYQQDPEYRLITEMLNPSWKERIDMRTVQEQWQKIQPSLPR
ncbi:MAG: protein kinase [Zetaproteobacteria bacterium]|nr:protein kinase [Zetaproteobacteria bacterium]